LDCGKAAEGDGLGTWVEDKAEVGADGELPIVIGWAAVEFFGTGWEKKKKEHTAASAVRAIKTMATAPLRLFIFCLIP